MRRCIVGIMLTLVVMLGVVGLTGCSVTTGESPLPKGSTVSFYDEEDKLISSVTLDCDATITVELVSKTFTIKKSDGSLVEVPEGTYSVRAFDEDGKKFYESSFGETEVEETGMECHIGGK